MIGVFDSGSGGLTILRALASHAPQRSFLYLGDHEGAPYGERAFDDIAKRTERAVDFLFSQGCRLVILACNTASVALRSLQEGWLRENHPDKRVLGVLVPVVEAVTGRDWGDQSKPSSSKTGKVVVFATHRTVESNIFKIEINRRTPALEVAQIACPRLVGLIESGAAQEVLEEAVFDYVSKVKGYFGGDAPDDAILGCTHYPLVKRWFAEALPETTRILSQPDFTAERLGDYLQRHPEIDIPVRRQELSFLTTGKTDEAGALASAFWERQIRFQKIPSFGNLA